MMKHTLLALAALLLAPLAALHAAGPAPPHPVTNPESPLMLAGAWVPDDPHWLAFDKVPRVPSQHVVISDVRAVASSSLSLDKSRGGVNQHQSSPCGHTLTTQKE